MYSYASRRMATAGSCWCLIYVGMLNIEQLRIIFLRWVSYCLKFLPRGLGMKELSRRSSTDPIFLLPSNHHGHRHYFMRLRIGVFFRSKLPSVTAHLH